MTMRMSKCNIQRNSVSLRNLVAAVLSLHDRGDYLNDPAYAKGEYVRAHLELLARVLLLIVHNDDVAVGTGDLRDYLSAALRHVMSVSHENDRAAADDFLRFLNDILGADGFYTTEDSW